MYTDPGLGSLLIQVLLGSLVGIPLLIGLFWNKIKGLFKRRGKDEPRD